jgi:hypothetical protein
VERFRAFIAVLHADLLERTRSLRFWIVLGICVMLTWWCFPPASATYMIVAMGGHYRGYYSSA